MICHERGLSIVWDTASAFHGTGGETGTVGQNWGVVFCQCGKYLAVLNCETHKTQFYVPVTKPVETQTITYTFTVYVKMLFAL